MFRNKYEFDKHPVVYSVSGDEYVPVYGSEYDKEHRLVVVEKGKRDQSAFINSFADSVDINVILNRFMNGDKEALMQRAGAYIDISAMPTNMSEFIQLSEQANSLFKTLPIEVKEKFNNNPVEFIAEFGSDKWLDVMSKSQQEIKNEVNQERKTVNSVYGDNMKVDYGFDSKPYGETETVSVPVVEEKKTASFDFLKGDK